MSMASLPMWLEGILNKKYPHWREVEYNTDGSAKYMPAGLRVLEASLLRHYPAADIAAPAWSDFVMDFKSARISV